MFHFRLDFTELKILKFINSEKATKFCEIFTLLLTTVHTVKSKVKISQNFVAFSEYMNFNFEIGKYVNKKMQHQKIKISNRSTQYFIDYRAIDFHNIILLSRQRWYVPRQYGYGQSRHGLPGHELPGHGLPGHELPRHGLFRRHAPTK